MKRPFYFLFFTWTSVTSVCWESFWRSFFLNKINIPVQTSPGLSLSFWGETRDALQDKRQCRRVMGKAASVCIGKDSKHYISPVGAVTSCWCHTWYCVPDACGNKHSALHNNQWLAYNLKMTILKSNFILMSNIFNGRFFFYCMFVALFFMQGAREEGLHLLRRFYKVSLLINAAIKCTHQDKNNYFFSLARTLRKPTCYSYQPTCVFNQHTSQVLHRLLEAGSGSETAAAQVAH